MDLKLELVILPVADVDRAKAFYEKAGFNLDVDHKASDEFRIVQFTPPGSACSISFGIGITDTQPGTVKGLHLVCTDIEDARAALIERGLDVDEIHHYEEGKKVPGVDPNHGRYNSFSGFADPDGNVWVLQEVPAEPAK